MAGDKHGLFRPSCTSITTAVRSREGKAKGDELWFVMAAPEQAGNQINQARLRFTGTLRGGEIEVTRQRESARNVRGTQTRGGTQSRYSSSS